MRVDADVVLCSSSGWAHGVRARGRKVVYCYTPARWLYQSSRYLGSSSRSARVALGVLAPRLRRWDRSAASTADRYLTSSQAVKQHILDVYEIDADVVPPPHTIDVGGPQRAIDGVEPDFYLCVARLLPYKNVDVVVDAMRRRPTDRLVVIGDGPEYRRLVSTAPKNVVFVQRVDDAILRWAYASCRALVASSYEDFGLTPLEAAAFGRPTVALRAGGYLDTIVEGVTGIFFDEPTPDQVAAALEELDATPFQMVDLLRQAEAFSETKFIERLQSIVADEARACR